MKNTLLLTCAMVFLSYCTSNKNQSDDEYFVLTREELTDKIMGAWAAQTIGVTYGGPTEFRYLKKTIPDSVNIYWSDTMMFHYMTRFPGLYDDIYMDFTFIEVMEKEGIEAPAASHAAAYANAKYWLWHANQQGRYNMLHGINPPESGHWLNNPHADDIDFQIEADFAGIMNPGMPNSALEVCDRVGHIMNAGDGYYGGVFMAVMYSYAFVSNDIDSIVNHALEHIPAQSTFYQCIADVVKWHIEYPTDWRKNWQMTEEKWGNDIGCPDGAASDFNIDAKINAAYVVMGLLYGEGDLGKTMDIATRAGQDSDCNPASAGAIVGTIVGYNNIPEYWKNGLSQIVDMDFKYTSTSLNEVYDISYRHAMEMITKNGGEIKDEVVRIKKQDPTVAPMEQNFENLALGEKDIFEKRILTHETQEWSVSFDGTGVVLRGSVGNINMPNSYALITKEETLDDYILLADFYIDDVLAKSMNLPLSFISRAPELFFQYQLPAGQHTLKMIIKNPNKAVFVDVLDLIPYVEK
ncbi:MAG: ADP-ribosylglycohydrolase family protein [Cyclobacteriaceae bacterium]|nr:ADP-ribosylglycohydrolase family protein [Cyclobacteriaceae bacterium]